MVLVYLRQLSVCLGTCVCFVIHVCVCVFVFVCVCVCVSVCLYTGALLDVYIKAGHFSRLYIISSCLLRETICQVSLTCSSTFMKSECQWDISAVAEIEICL